jgi:hypothetical protein
MRMRHAANKLAWIMPPELHIRVFFFAPCIGAKTKREM